MGYVVAVLIIICIGLCIALASSSAPRVDTRALDASKELSDTYFSQMKELSEQLRLLRKSRSNKHYELEQELLRLKLEVRAYRKARTADAETLITHITKPENASALEILKVFALRELVK